MRGDGLSAPGRTASPGRTVPPDRTAPGTAAPAPDGGRLVETLMHFGRVLRRAGMPVGPGQVIDAVQAIAAVGWSRRSDFYWTLHAVFVKRRDQRELFDQAFHMFWRNPDILGRMMALALPTLTPADDDTDRDPMLRRLREAMAPEPAAPPELPDADDTPVEIDASLTFSATEVLQAMDFEQMSRDEADQARRAIARLRLPVRDVPTRRFRPDPAGARADMRAMLRAALRQGGDSIPLRRKARRHRPPPLVILCDISGSMSKYSRMMLHFLHAVTNDRDRVHIFLFGTRLTNVTRPLRQRDVDIALQKVGATVQDWSGGTRLGIALARFNHDWARRVLGQGAVVLLITDGLDRDGGDGLAAAAARLHRSCRRLIWLNPLLRFDGYVPKSMGARALLPHVDELRGCHNLDSLADLAAALDRAPLSPRTAMRPWVERLAAADAADAVAPRRMATNGTVTNGTVI